MKISNIIESLTPFILDTNNISNILVCENQKTQNENITQGVKNSNDSNKSKINEDFFIPSQEDNLFWLWVVFLYGFSKYELLKRNSFTTEKKYKINFITKLRENKSILKKLKVKLPDIEGNLSSDKLLSIKSLEALLIIENYNFVYFDDKIYYENIIDSDNKTLIVKYFKNTNKHGMLMEEGEINKYKNNLFVVDNYTKPIKGISSYKAAILQEIASKLGIDIMKTPTKKKTKKEIYQLITEKLL
jgi:hypothetical protein